MSVNRRSWATPSCRAKCWSPTQRRRTITTGSVRWRSRTWATIRSDRQRPGRVRRDVAGGGLPRITLSEADPSRLAALHDRFDGDRRVKFAVVDLDSAQAGDYSSVVSFNVMEHIPDDAAAFAAAFHLLRPGGYFVTFAPAFPSAMSQFDRAIGHVRRYTRAEIRSKYVGAGFDIVDCRYVNAPGLFAWFMGMRVMRMTPGDGPVLRVWDRAVVPVARKVESKVKAPFGQSVLAVGRRRQT